MSLTVITGAGGLIAGHMVKRLLWEGHEVRGVDIKPINDWQQLDRRVDNVRADLANDEQCHRALDGADLILNYAANMGGIFWITSQRVATMHSGDITSNVLREAALNKAKFFGASSACVYSEDIQSTEDDVYLKESDAWPARPDSDYGWEKLTGERFATAYHDEDGLDIRIARFHNIMGRHTEIDGGREKAPAAICRKVAEAVLTGSHEVEVWGDGRQKRSFMHVDECNEGVMRLLASDFTQPLNIGSSELVTINQLVDMVEEIAGVKLKRTYDLDAPQGVRSRCSDNTLCANVLDWQPSASLFEGLCDLYPWVYDEVAKKLR